MLKKKQKWGCVQKRDTYVSQDGCGHNPLIPVKSTSPGLFVVGEGVTQKTISRRQFDAGSRKSGPILHNLKMPPPPTPTPRTREGKEEITQSRQMQWNGSLVTVATDSSLLWLLIPRSLCHPIFRLETTNENGFKFFFLFYVIKTCITFGEKTQKTELGSRGQDLSSDTRWPVSSWDLGHWVLSRWQRKRDAEGWTTPSNVETLGKGQGGTGSFK